MNKDFTIIPGKGAAIYWPDIDKNFRFVTVDEDGVIEAWESKPEQNSEDGFWHNGGSNEVVVRELSGYTISNWQELIFERPE